MRSTQFHIGRRRLPMRTASTRLICITVGMAGFAVFAPPSQAREERHAPPPTPVHCTDLATDPANGLLGALGVKSVNSQVIAAAGSNAAYCQVNILYGTNPDQNINIRV